jgi:hydrogenase maturation protease
MDLAYALDGYDVVVFLDATPRGGAPGTLYVIQPDLEGLPLDVDAHAMDPLKVLAFAKTLGGELPRTYVLGCEPSAAEEFTDLSEPVRGALPEAERLLSGLLDDVLSGKEMP